ncbi:MAG TPA: hypothetical protein VHZ76_03860 [Gammaproteobacteria bacterium]|jgi:dienelactone hydrolase|nr:hypothetical protein [Gammaproteobacteria bacterium]
MNTKNDFVKLYSKDGHHLDAFYCPAEKNDIGLIVIHEIFGLTPFIQQVCEYWAHNCSCTV